MHIGINDELSFDLSNRRQRKEFLAHVHHLAEKEQFDDLLNICKKLNKSLSKSSSFNDINDALELQNLVIVELEKIVKIYPQKKFEPQDAETTSIGISFRHDEGKRMHGAFFDHYVIRNITKRRTHILASPQTELEKLKEFSAQTTFSLSMGDNGKKIIPKHINHANQDGLILIPGYSRQLFDEGRIAFENELIRKARLNGQPILAICAGSWTLWNAFGGQTTEVQDHVYSSMPYIVSDGGVGNNKQIHQVRLKKNTITFAALMKQGLTTHPTVNSVHWMAPDASTLPSSLEITATAKKDGGIEVSSRQGTEMSPEENTVEAFETKHGAPMLGIQWHPECYYSKQNKSPEERRHLNLIQYMALAGDTYQAKRRMLQELKSVQKLEKISIFKTLAALQELKMVENFPGKYI